MPHRMLVQWTWIQILVSAIFNYTRHIKLYTKTKRHMGLDSTSTVFYTLYITLHYSIHRHSSIIARSARYTWNICIPYTILGHCKQLIENIYWKFSDKNINETECVLAKIYIFFFYLFKSNWNLTLNSMYARKNKIIQKRKKN